MHIDIRLKAREVDKVSCEGINFDRFAHIKDKDFTAVSINAGLKDESNGLWDSHKVADDIRVSHGNGPARLNLLLKERDDGTVAAKDVAETNGDEFRRSMSERIRKVLIMERLVLAVCRRICVVEGVFTARIPILAVSLGQSHCIAKMSRDFGSCSSF